MAPKQTEEYRTRRARADHAAAALEALHAAIETLGRAQYHLATLEVANGTPLTARVSEALTATNCAHALARILADRLP